MDYQSAKMETMNLRRDNVLFFDARGTASAMGATYTSLGVFITMLYHTFALPSVTVIATAYQRIYMCGSTLKMAALQDVVSLYQNLKQEWTKTPCNLKKCGELLNQLKIGLTNLIFLPTSNSIASPTELIIARDILEIGAQWSIATEDIPSFERYMAQLKCYYFDYKSELLESAYKYQLLGLNLLFLLSQNRVAEFHTELELLPSDQIQSNVYIRHPLSLEQYLMEGSYNKIFLAKGNVPAASYNFFIDILLNTVRDEIGACMESAYDKISIWDALRMLNLSTEKEMKAFGAKKNWNLSKDGYFNFSTTNEKKSEEPIPSSDLATLAIDYARELEMIV